MRFKIPKTKKSKYNAVPTASSDGVMRDSKAEAKFVDDLLFRLRIGEIKDLELQKKYLLIPAQKNNGKCVERACSYLADAVYWDVALGCSVIADKKGFKTADYIIKRKLMLERHGIRILEV